MTAGKLAILATEKYSVKLRPPITPKATQVPNELAALGKKLQKATSSGRGTCSLLFIAPYDKEDELRPKVTVLRQK